MNRLDEGLIMFVEARRTAAGFTIGNIPASGRPSSQSAYLVHRRVEVNMHRVC